MSKADCRKFAPNVFNKNKCASCFKAKEEHSDEALENNRASRKVAKCGYLFAAPDWDFSNPINRTKRWQRRWFVLYDDGELTYSVDEHPETVPQAIIDMNRVVEVSEAEEVTGHPFSLALTAADRVHFLKGTSREESKWWFDILSMFPRTNMKTGRHKRNATFPGSKATTIISTQQQQQHQQSTAPNSPCLSKGVSIQPFQTPPMSRPRFHSHTESLVRSGAQQQQQQQLGGLGLQNFNLLPVKDTNGRNGSSGNKKIAIDEDDIIPVKEAPLSVSPAVVAASPCPPPAAKTAAEKDIVIIDKDLIDDKIKTRRVNRREIRGARSARCNSEILSSLIIPPGNNNMNNGNNSSANNTAGKGYALVLPSSTLTAPIGSKNNAGLSSSTSDRPRSALLPPVPPTTVAASPAAPRSPVINNPANPHSPFYLYMADVPRNRHYESLESLQHAFTNMNSPSRARHSSSKDMPDSAGSHKTEPVTPVMAGKDRPMSMHELGSAPADRLRGLSSLHETSLARPTSERQTSKASRQLETINPPGETVRGDPDGCGLDPVTSFCSPLPDRRSTLTLTSPLLDDSLRKGWLLRLSYGGEWKKYWFVLRYSLLSLYRDHSAEDAGLADDTIDMAQIASVEETDSGRSYGFQMAAVDGKRHSLAALTSGIRSQWIQALRNACNQQGKMAHLPTKLVSSASAAALKAVKENVDPAGIGRREVDSESLESYDGSTTDADEEDDNELDDGDVIVHQSEDEEDGNLPGSEPIPSLPPSPPLNRTAMSKVKERDRSRSSSRSRSRHRSASPSSVRTNSPPATALVYSVPPTSVSESNDGHLQARLDAAKCEITRLLNERREQEREAQQQLVTLNARLAEKEQQMSRLAGILEATKAESQRQLIDIQNLLDKKEAELSSLRNETANDRTENAELRDSLKRERSEVYKLRDVAQELRSLLDSRNDTLNQLQSKTNEVEVLNRRLKATQDTLHQTQERLQRGIDENEGLFARLRQMEENSGNVCGSAGGAEGTGSSSLRRSRSSTGSMPLPLQLCNRNLLGGSSKKSLPRLDSLSDLSNIDYDLDLEALDRESLVDEYVELRARFERSLVEIRALKRELRQTQSAMDGFEVAHMALKQQWQAKEGDYTSQLSLMAARVQDLTAKMAAADKQVRQLKIKVAKSESREKRRTQSLKGRESFQLSKEVEDKLVDLEHKMAALGTGTSSSSAEKDTPPSRARKGFEEPTKSFRMRRKSLEGGAIAGGDSVKILLRVDQLEQQVAGRQSSSKKTSSIERKNSLPGRSPQGKPPRSSPLKAASGTASTGLSVKQSAMPDGPITRPSKIVQDLEQCVVEMELMFDSNKVDGHSLIGKIRAIQQELLNPDGVRVAVSSSDGACQVEKIQDLLRVRLSELKVKRDQVRSLGKLDSAAVSQIAAEKLALELSIAEQLSMVTAAKLPEEREMLRDANWTIHKLGWLKRKLSGEKSAPALDQSTSFGTYCAALAERLSAIAAISSTSRSHQGAEGGVDMAANHSMLPTRVAQHLAEEERDLSILFSKYKEEKLQELARLLAHETLRMGDGPSADNQLVEEVKVREAWLEAQEVANKELVDSEVRQAMTRMAEVFAEDVADEERLASALLLWPAQQLQYEQRCQVVEEVLRSEMEEAVLLLSNAYERSLQQMKAQTTILHPPEGDLEAALSEFAEVVAHKALIDGHIAVLQGETPSQPLATSTGSDSSIVQNVSIIQETEAIVSSLSSTDFFPASLNCGEVAAILHRNLAEPRSKPEESMSGNGNKSSAINEEMIRQKYQAEIEQLRALTEKGMSAMEGSHKRIIAQMEEKHQQDLNRLQVEKERALAEETQATLAALDAMRKAHQAEVQREIARFKEEFLSQMAARQAPAEREMTPNREQEMEEIRRQILSLSEKYSHKCLESAALEQKVSSLSQQVAVSQRQILDLDSRNQQLRSFLDTGTGVDHQPDASPAEVLRAKESQLLMLQEDVAELQFCLRESQSREEELAAMARNMGQYLRTERTLQSDEVAALRHRLEDLLLLSGPSSGGSGGNSACNSILGRKNSSSDDKSSPSRESPPRESIRFHYVRSKDLTRSPSCPRLSGFLSLAPRLTARPVLSAKDPSQALNGSSTTTH
ncbi:protein outspread-like [Daphnia carinata]|uniref:protein outspread-like n=1 Tax=Daphnia carinata TaxID=120202 RepID=UPI00257FF97F|nr:protein outspread-like [Daphnia carinata]